MAYQRCVSGIWLSLVEQRLKAAGRTLQEEGFDSVGHSLFYHDFCRSPEPVHFAGEGSLSSE